MCIYLFFIILYFIYLHTFHKYISYISLYIYLLFFNLKHVFSNLQNTVPVVWHVFECYCEIIKDLRSCIVCVIQLKSLAVPYRPPFYDEPWRWQLSDLFARHVERSLWGGAVPATTGVVTSLWLNASCYRCV